MLKTGLYTKWLPAWLAGAAMLVALGACESDRTRPLVSTGVGSSSASSSSGSGGASLCAEGALRDCKVQIDQRNCFAGAQRCEQGTWSECIDPSTFGETSWHETSLGGAAACASNPCNPLCQTFDEDPTPDLEAGGAPPPANASGTVDDVPSSIRSSCIDDITTACADCSTPGSCQLDTHCSGGRCVPWYDGEMNTGSGLPDFTVKVGCDPNTVLVCNRGDAAGGNGVGISVWNPVPDLCGANPCDPAIATGLAATATLATTCSVPADIAPGTCASVSCNIGSNAAVMYHVNGCDEFACVSEADSLNNWGYFNNSIGCSCAAASVSSTLRDVTMYMLLDNSLSMSGSGIWTPAKNAVKSFLQDPGSASINLAFRMYGDYPASGCNSSSCNGTACEAVVLSGPRLLSDTTYVTDLVNYIDPAGTIPMTPHRAVLQGMANWATNWAIANPTDLTTLVYITDGGTVGACSSGGYNGTNAPTIAAPIGGVYASQGVATYAVALPGADLTLLNEIAGQGGTTLIDLTGSSDVNADLTMALQAIQGALLSCAIPIPNASTVDPSGLSLTYVPTSGTDQVFSPVANLGACSTGAQYYLLPDASNPTDVVMCPDICTTVRGDTGSAVEFAGGCVGAYTPQQHVFEYDGDCSSYPSGSSAVWNFLSYDTTMVGDATVDFELSTSNESAAAAAMGPWTSVSTATFSNPDVPGSSPIDLRSMLSTSARAPYAALRITVNPVSAGSSTPTVNDWDLQYNCEDNE